MKAVKPSLQVILRKIRANTNLSACIGGSVTIGGGEIEVRRRTVVVGDVAVIEGGKGQHNFGIESVDQREINQSVGFVVAIAKTDGRVLRSEVISWD